MNNMIRKLTSRKFLLAVVGELLALAWKSKDRKTKTDDEEAKG